MIGLQLVVSRKMKRDSLIKVIETGRFNRIITGDVYKQNTFGCFRKNSELQFVQKTPKTVLLITRQPNIAQRLLFIQNEMQDILYHLI